MKKLPSTLKIKKHFRTEDHGIWGHLCGAESIRYDLLSELGEDYCCTVDKPKVTCDKCKELLKKGKHE